MDDMTMAGVVFYLAFLQDILEFNHKRMEFVTDRGESRAQVELHISEIKYLLDKINGGE